MMQRVQSKAYRVTSKHGISRWTWALCLTSLSCSAPDTAATLDPTEHDLTTESSFAELEQDLLNATLTWQYPEAGWIEGTCTATLVDERYLVTAAHCFSGRTGPVSGKTFVVRNTAGVEVARSALDYVYMVHNGSPGSTDLALARLVSPIPSTIAKPATFRTSVPANGTPVGVLGYGCTDRTTQAQDSRKRVFNTTYGTPIAVSCPGDSGGPRYVARNGVLEIWGITSYMSLTGGPDGIGDAVRWGAPLLRGVRTLGGTTEVNAASNADTSNELGRLALVEGFKSVAGDFNGDGFGDLAITGAPYWSIIVVAFGARDGTFTSVTSSLPQFAELAQDARKLVAHNFDDDGKTDLALVGNADWTTLPVAFSNGDGSFRMTNQPIAGFQELAASEEYHPIVGDFDGNGRGEIALLGGQSGTFTFPIAVPSGTSGHFDVVEGYGVELLEVSRTSGVQIAVGNFDGDDDDDVALVGWAGPRISNSFPDRDFVTSMVSMPMLTEVVGGNLLAGDFNGDGLDDLAVAGGSGLALRFAFSQYGGAVFREAYLPTRDLQLALTESTTAFALRLNSDSTTDIVGLGGYRGNLPVGLLRP